MNGLTPLQRKQRLNKCQQEGLCFISLKPLDKNDKLALYWLLRGWLEPVAVKAQYAPTYTN